MVELQETTIGLLGELAGRGSEIDLLLVDTVIRWLEGGCPRTFAGPTNGAIRFVIRNGRSDQLFDPAVFREERVHWENLGRTTWHQVGWEGHPARAMKAALNSLHDDEEDLAD